MLTFPALGEENHKGSSEPQSGPASGTSVSELLADFRRGVDRPELFRYYEKHFVRAKFRDRHRVRLRNGKLTDIGNRPALTDKDVVQQLKWLEERNVQWWRGCSTVSEARMDEIRDTAGPHPTGRPLPDLNNIFFLELPRRVTSPEVVRRLRKLGCIDYALFVSRPVTVPSGTVCVPDFADPNATLPADIVFGRQFYLGAAPTGVEAFFAWEGFLGDGTGVQIVDIEYNCNPNHSDLTPVEVLHAPGPNLASDIFGNHGTSVLGVMGSRDNGFGTTGIAHGADILFTSEWRRKPFLLFWEQGVQDRFEAINEAIAEISSGDVIVLEMQEFGPNYNFNDTSDNGLVAAEWDKSVYDAITVAVASGRIVCAAAGNGTENLDAAAYSTNAPGWPANQGPFQIANDSGSIMVGAGVPAGFLDGSGNPIPGLIPEAFSNTGATVDMHGWGRWVVTTGTGDIIPMLTDPTLAPLITDPDLQYTNNFGGTSSATPMVAGCAAIIQATFTNINGTAGTASQILNILQSNGTAQAGGGNIGPFPDLRLALRSMADPSVLDAPEPTVTPAFGEKFAPLTMQLGYSEAGQDFNNTRIHYTLDGSDPTLESYRYTPEFSTGHYLRRTVTVKARTFRFEPDMQRWFPGPIVEGVYEFSDKVGPPGFFSVGGAELMDGASYSWPMAIAMHSETPDATIRYELGGAINPNDGSAEIYIEPLSLDPGTHFIFAYAEKEGVERSDIVGFSIELVSYGANSVGGTVQVDPPTIEPESGVYGGVVSVSMTGVHPFVNIHYTLDGSEPTTSSPEYTEQINLSSSAVVRAKAFSGSLIPSEIVSRLYTVLDEPTAPTITPDSGDFSSNVSVSMSTPTAGAQIYYTTNGGEPTVTSNLYTGPFILGIGFHTVKAASFLVGAEASTTTEAVLNVFDPANTIQPPVIKPLQGNQTLLFALDLTSATQDAQIHYTINQIGTVDQNDRLHDPANPQLLGANPPPNPMAQYLIRARAFKGGQASLQMQKNFNVFWPFDGNGNRNEIETPTIEPPGGVYHNRVTVNFRTSTPSAQFMYTTDGSDPPESSTSRSKNRTGGSNEPSVSTNESVSSSRRLKVVAQRLGFFDSEVTEEEYVLICATPEISPEPGPYSGMVEISMTSETQFADIHYTTDGSEPDQNSPEYDDPFSLGEGTHFVKTRAFRNGFEPSETVSALFQVGEPAAAPQITDQPQSVSVPIGATATFTVVATGSPLPGYSWERNDQPLGEETATLVLPNVQAADAGTFTVVVSNREGSVTSNPVTLSVTDTIEAWRLHFFGTDQNTGDAADNMDPDGDGRTNRQEFDEGTDPTDPASVFRIRSLRRSSDGGTLTLTWPSVAGKEYRIAKSPDLRTWTAVSNSDLTGTGGDLSLEVSLQLGEDEANFRIEVVVP